MTKLPEGFVEFESAKQGPTLTILGGIHGDETVGIDVVKQLEIILNQTAIKCGKIVLGVGNLKAAALEPPQRFIEKDLNRCFTENEGNSYEEQRAEEIKTVLEQTDVLLDLHSTIKPSVPFIVVANHDFMNHPHAQVITKLGIEKVMFGDGLGDVNTDTYTAKFGGLGITVETGYQKDINVDEILNKVVNAIKSLGILDNSNIETEPTMIAEEELELLDAYHNVIATPGFKFTKDWQNFEEIQEGEKYAEDENGDIIAEKKSQIVFAKPKDKIILGQQAAMLLAA